LILVLLRAASGYVKQFLTWIVSWWMWKFRKKQYVCPVHCIRRHRTVASISITDPTFKMVEGQSGMCELDTHADTCVAGANFLACEFTGNTCDVSPFTRR
jgi:hypothetical protein